MSAAIARFKDPKLSDPAAHTASAGAAFGNSDRAILFSLLAESLAVLNRDPNAARRCIEAASLLIRKPAEGGRAKNARLADWQLRRAKEFILNNLGANLRIEVVASAVQLSASYFSRSFKATVGIAYSDFVTGARVDLAKRLLLTTDVPISEIALICGLADQPHLTRVFNRVVGLPPNAWRRQFLGKGFADPAAEDLRKPFP